MFSDIANTHTAGRASIADPISPNDDLTFEELASRYNHMLTSDRRRVFVRLLMKECKRRSQPVRVLDIGCGGGIGETSQESVAYLGALREYAGELWGLEPDPQMNPAHRYFDRFEHATMETAQLPPESIDIAYSFFVMEHVSDPVRFLTAVYRCLRPGGTYLFMTPNGKHYFTRIAKCLRALRLDEWVLRRVRGDVTEEYHYPVCYKCNSPQQIGRYARAVGFGQVDCAFIEREGPRPYFPKWALPAYHLLALKRRLIHSRTALLELICRMTKP